jgi:hypothetical protein
LGKPLGVHGNAIGARKKAIDAKVAAVASCGFALQGRIDGMDDDLRGRDPAAAGVLDDAAKRATWVLCLYGAREEHSGQGDGAQPGMAVPRESSLRGSVSPEHGGGFYVSLPVQDYPLPLFHKC